MCLNPKCMSGMVEVGEGAPMAAGTWRPCEVCRPQTYQRWQEAHYQRNGRDRPPELPLRILPPYEEEAVW